MWNSNPHLLSPHDVAVRNQLLVNSIKVLISKLPISVCDSRILVNLPVNSAVAVPIFGTNLSPYFGLVSRIGCGATAHCESQG